MIIDGRNIRGQELLEKLAEEGLDVDSDEVIKTITLHCVEGVIQELGSCEYSTGEPGNSLRNVHG